MTGTILLAGVHGVGKSTAAEKLTIRFGIPNFTASEIIKSVKSTSISTESKRVGNIADNQTLLLKGVSQHLESNRLIILDGHFTLFDSKFQIQKIDESVFKDLSLVGVLLLMDNPEVIYNRQAIRDGQPLPIEVIIENQNLEFEHAEFITKKLNIPFVSIEHYTDKKLFDEFQYLTKIS